MSASFRPTRKFLAPHGPARTGARHQGCPGLCRSGLPIADRHQLPGPGHQIHTGRRRGYGMSLPGRRQPGLGVRFGAGYRFWPCSGSETINFRAFLPGPQHRRQPAQGYRSANRAFIPVIVLTCREPQANKNGALRAGARLFFQKPVDNEELLAAVRAALQNPVPQTTPTSR